MYPYGLIGNCQAAALVSDQASVDWFCLPRPDSPPVFGRLLDAEGGHFSVEPAEGSVRGRQAYLPNTNVLVTTVTTLGGAAYRVTDFLPRYSQQGGIVRPMVLYRTVEPISGSPQIRVECRPVNGWEKQALVPEMGDGWLRFTRGSDFLRLRTNMPLTYLNEGIPFHLKEKLHFALGWNTEAHEDFPRVVDEHREKTIDYWNTWVKHCSIPTLYQTATIRSALALKLHCYEDTGAILAALTTSLPEEPDGTRNWDYRYCWLRDAYFCLSAFRNLGHFEEMEGFLNFLLNIAHSSEVFQKLSPVYRLDRTLPLPELEHKNWSGFAGGRPVRSGNQAAEHTQNDVYGEMILTLAPIFFDERFHGMRTPAHQKLMEQLASLCIENTSAPDAGLWEVRAGWQEHSFSNLMCWAGIDRVMRIRRQGYLQNLETDLEMARRKVEEALKRATRDGAVYNGPEDATLDASLLLLPLLNYPDKSVSAATVDRIWTGLRFDGTSHPSFLYRYLREDDFGKPKSPFLICSFWLVQALAKVGRRPEATQVMEGILASGNGLGLLAEHYLPQTSTQWGNFPQAYSHVGLINAAFAISPEWDQIL